MLYPHIPNIYIYIIYNLCYTHPHISEEELMQKSSSASRGMANSTAKACSQALPFSQALMAELKPGIVSDGRS